MELRSRHAQRRAGADHRARRAPRPSSPGRCPPRGEPLVELEDLVRFAGHPVRAFLRQRLGISVGDYADEVDDALPVELDALERWGVGQRLLDGVLGGASIEALRRGRDRARDAAPGQARDARDRRIRPIVAHIAAAAKAELDGAGARAGLGRRQGRAPRRPHAERNRPRRLRRRAADRDLLARQRPPPPAGLRPLARADRGASRARLHGGHHRAGAAGARPTARRSRSPGSRRSPTTRASAQERALGSRSRRWSTSTTAACASRSRSPA